MRFSLYRTDWRHARGGRARAPRCRPPSPPNRPHFDADSIESAILRPLGRLEIDATEHRELFVLGDVARCTRSTWCGGTHCRDAHSLAHIPLGWMTYPTRARDQRLIGMFCSFFVS